MEQNYEAEKLRITVDVEKRLENPVNTENS